VNATTIRLADEKLEGLQQIYSDLISTAAPHSNLKNTYTSALNTLPKS